MCIFSLWVHIERTSKVLLEGSSWLMIYTYTWGINDFAKSHEQVPWIAGDLQKEGWPLKRKWNENKAACEDHTIKRDMKLLALCRKDVQDDLTNL